GPRFVRWLLKHHLEWDQFRQRYKELAKLYQAKAGSNAVAGRQAPQFAVIALTAELVHKNTKFPWKHKNPIDSIWDELTVVTAQADRAAEALRSAVDFYHQNVRRFFNRMFFDVENSLPPPSGWAGVVGAADAQEGEPGAETVVGDRKWKRIWLGFFP